MTRRTWFLAAAVLWTVGIFVGTWLPPAAMPHPELEGSSLFLFLRFDKIVHAVMFTGFAFLWLQAHRGPTAPFRGVLAAGVFVAILTETVQATPWVGRDGDVWDVLADCAGLLIGTGLFWCWSAKSRISKSVSNRPANRSIDPQSVGDPPRAEPLASRSGS
jgi:hypothetical protein